MPSRTTIHRRSSNQQQHELTSTTSSHTEHIPLLNEPFLSEAGQTFALVCGFGALRVFFLLHVMVFPMGEKLYAQVVNLRSLMHSLVGIISTVIAGMGFGKPYSPIMVYTFGFILNSIVSLIMLGMPGLFDWVDKYIPMISCFVLYAEYVCRGR